VIYIYINGNVNVDKNEMVIKNYITILNDKNSNEKSLKLAKCRSPGYLLTFLDISFNN